MLFRSEQYGSSLDINDLIEVDFKNEGVIIGDKARITGKIDKMHIQDNDLIISDWKTGRPQNTFDSTGDSAIKLLDYRRQLLFYKLLIDGSNTYKKYNAVEGILEFLEIKDNVFNKLSLNYEEKEIERLKKLIEIVYNKIINLDFPDTSKYSKNYTGCIEFENDLLEGNI